MLGDHPAGCHRKRFAFDRQNAINQHQRLIGKTHSGGKGVRLGVASAQGLCDAAYGKVHALVAGKGTANLGQYLFYVGSEKRRAIRGALGFRFRIGNRMGMDLL